MKSATIKIVALSFIIALILTGCNDASSNGGASQSLNNPPAQATISGHTAVYAGQSNPFVCLATDPEGQAIRYEFDWNGDALPDEEREEVQSRTLVSTTHRFGTAGAYTVQCRAKDGSGEAGEWSNAITVVVSEMPGAEQSPFGVFGPFEYQLDDPTVATDEQVIGYLTDIGVPWVQEMYFTSAVPLIPQSINIYSRVGAEGGMMPLPCPALDAPAWIQYEQDYAAALRNKVIQWKGRIRYFEVATEPGGFPPPAGWKNCEQNYADHLKTTYTVVKQECPGCKVVYGGLSGVYIDFDETFYSAQFLDKTLAAGAASYFDVFEFKQHAHRATDYAELRNKYQVYAAIFSKYGLDLDKIPVFVETAMYDGDPCLYWAGSECGDPFVLSFQSEGEQAAGLVKTYVFGLASGIDRIFWNLMIERYNFSGVSTNVFNMYGLIHNPRNDGLSHKKLAYYTYKKMIEVLDGSDWSIIQMLQKTDNVYIYKLMKNGNPLYVAWWDYFNDATYTPGKTIQVSFSGLQGVSAVVTETVPKFATGMEVTDYTTAFNTSVLTISNGSAALELGENPVFMEVLQ